jgi:hypothetical protein
MPIRLLAERSDCRGQAAPLVKPPKATIGQKLEC